jgi:hypothetical protein
MRKLIEAVSLDKAMAGAKARLLAMKSDPEPASVTQTLVQQFKRFAPLGLKFEGRAYAMGSTVVKTGPTSARFDYIARKRPGNIINDKIAVSVEYKAGKDLYDIKIEFVDGTSLDSRLIKASNGHYFEDFENLQYFLR